MRDGTRRVLQTSEMHGMGGETSVSTVIILGCDDDRVGFAIARAGTGFLDTLLLGLWLDSPLGGPEVALGPYAIIPAKDRGCFSGTGSQPSLFADLPKVSCGWDPPFGP